MTDVASWVGALEVRQVDGATVLAGSMPYNQTATVADRGTRRKERLGSDAMGWQVKKFAEVQAEMNRALATTIDRARLELLEEQLERANVNVLVGHDFGKPLGDLKRGTARVTSNADELAFEVDLPPEELMPTYMLDVVKEVRIGRAGGISPGFRIPPKGVSPNAEQFIPEPGNPGVQIRVVNDAIMPEVSIVTRPVYPSAVDLRDEDHAETAYLFEPRSIYRWL